ncbi:MAG: S8 family serine peptidase, partial [Chloroflexales bacterium]|nr:S8 family serine peptidase [Chloroflexales bacterium]
MSRQWLRFVSMLTITLMILGVGLLAQPTKADELVESDEYVPGEVLIKLFNASKLNAVANDYNLNPTPIDQFGQRPIYRMEILDGVLPPDKAEALEEDRRVEYAEPNFISLPPESRQRSLWVVGGSSGEYVGQWAPDMIRLDEAHTVTSGAGITVAVLDTGVDFTHPELQGKLLQGFDFVDFDNDPSEVGVYETDVAFGHGTHVAGLVALAAPDAKILPVRVLDRDGAGNVWVLIEALNYAIDPDSDSDTNDGAQVINMSLGTLRETDLLEDIIEEVTCEDDDEEEEEE